MVSIIIVLSGVASGEQKESNSSTDLAQGGQSLSASLGIVNEQLSSSAMPSAGAFAGSTVTRGEGMNSTSAGMLAALPARQPEGGGHDSTSALLEAAGGRLAKGLGVAEDIVAAPSDASLANLASALQSQ